MKKRLTDIRLKKQFYQVLVGLFILIPDRLKQSYQVLIGLFILIPDRLKKNHKINPHSKTIINSCFSYFILEIIIILLLPDDGILNSAETKSLFNFKDRIEFGEILYRIIASDNVESSIKLYLVMIPREYFRLLLSETAY